MARCLLDTGCTKSMILKRFTDKKRRTKLSDKDFIKYETYGSSFKSSMTASVGFKMVEFEQQKNNTVEYEFQVKARNADGTETLLSGIGHGSVPATNITDTYTTNGAGVSQWLSNTGVDDTLNPTPAVLAFASSNSANWASGDANASVINENNKRTEQKFTI